MVRHLLLDGARRIGKFYYNEFMAVEAYEIYRFLPKIDCGQCPAKSCLALAREVAEDYSKLSQCTRLTPYGLMLIEGLFAEGR